MAKIDQTAFRALAAPHRIADGAGFRLADHDPADTGRFGSGDKDEAKELLSRSAAWIADDQARLAARNRSSLLLLFQGMDASGKDSAIRHVLAGLDPQGCEVHSFKAPSEEERDHDFLWRHARRAPERGRIGIHNRSYYEEVLIVRVHPALLAAQRLPSGVGSRETWAGRYESIRDYETHLHRNGTVVRKFFLHISRKEQRKRFLARLDEPDKNWKFSAQDVEERRHWARYQRAYQDAIRHTATADAPWFAVPADHKWYARLVIAAAVVDALAGMDLAETPPTAARRRDLAKARAALEGEKASEKAERKKAAAEPEAGERPPDAEDGPVTPDS